MQGDSNVIIVVGAGLSGGSAAMTILEAGGKVILLEKEKRVGGNSVRASSGINAAGTKHQEQQGIKDSVELFAKDTAFSMFKDVNAKPTPLVQTLCENSAEAVHWLEDHQLSIPVLSQNGGHSASRTHRPVTGAAGGYITLGLLRSLRKYEESGQCKVVKQAKVTKLLKDEQNRVVGVEYESLDDKRTHKLKGGAVIIATGGFCYNKDLLKKYTPFYHNLPTTNGPWTTGDGMLFAQAAGAELVDMECVQVHPTGFVDPKEPNAHEKTLAAECLRAAGALLINAEGHRFVDELGHRDDVTAAERAQKGPIRLILNPVAVSEVVPHVNMYEKHFKVLTRYENAQALAKEMKIPVDNLWDTFNSYNESARKKWCPSGKKRFPGSPYSIDQPLMVGFVTPVLHYVMGGIAITPKAEVIDKNKHPIRGLYASGETTGGVHGKNRLAGNSLVDCVVYGRVAGKAAVRYVSENKSKL
jgi:flavocytochrome c